MTYQEAKIVLLEDALIQAQHTVNFLHCCLINPSGDEKINGGYKYVYPDQTVERLKKWNELVPLKKSCHHSGFEKDCESCQERIKRMKLLCEAKKTVAIMIKYISKR